MGRDDWGLYHQYNASVGIHQIVITKSRSTGELTSSRQAVRAAFFPPVYTYDAPISSLATICMRFFQRLYDKTAFTCLETHSANVNRLNCYVILKVNVYSLQGGIKTTRNCSRIQFNLTTTGSGQTICIRKPALHTQKNIL